MVLSPVNSNSQMKLVSDLWTMLKLFSGQLNGKSSVFAVGFTLPVFEICHRSITKAFVYSWKSMMNLVVIPILLSVEKIMHTKRNKSPLCFHSLMVSYFRR